jgi:hypothetical protein
VSQVFVPVHAVPSGALGFEHCPVAESHDPATWQASLAMHVTGLDPTHVPEAQVYVRSQLFDPAQAVPSGAVGLEHVPEEGSHAPAAWQASLAVHRTGFDPVQVPLWQASVCVHAFPSSHPVPSGAAGFEHTPVVVLHEPAT